MFSSCLFAPWKSGTESDPENLSRDKVLLRRMNKIEKKATVLGRKITFAILLQENSLDPLVCLLNAFGKPPPLLKPTSLAFSTPLSKQLHVPGKTAPPKLTGFTWSEWIQISNGSRSPYQAPNTISISSLWEKPFTPLSVPTPCHSISTNQFAPVFSEG